jgi:hypothetical protein
LVEFPSPLVEMCTFVIGALTFVFWSCIPMSPKPPSLDWLPAVDTGAALGVTGADAAVAGQLPEAGDTSTTRSTVRVSTGRLTSVNTMKRARADKSVNKVSTSQRFSMYMLPPRCACDRRKRYPDTLGALGTVASSFAPSALRSPGLCV